MSFLKLFFNEVFYRPLLNGLVFLTSVLPWHDLGFAVILLTLLLRILLFPWTHKMLRTQTVMKKIEPEVKKIYAEKKNKEEQAQALMALYKTHGISPFSGFFALLIQMPLLFALYRVFWKGIPFQPNDVYFFISIPPQINTLFLGFISLTQPSVGLAALAAVSQYFQARLAFGPQQTKSGDTQKIMQMQMIYFFPVLIFFIAFKLPAAVSLYWTAMNVFAIIHEAVVRRSAAYDGTKQKRTI